MRSTRRTDTHTYAIDRTTRRHVWRYPLGGALALAGDQGTLYIANASGALAAVALR